MIKTTVFVTLFLTLAACSMAQPERTQEDFDEMLSSLYTHSVPLIKTEELKEIYDDDILLLDIREKGEYEVSHIPGAVYGGYLSFKKKTVKDIPKDKPIVVYCSVGKRSEEIGDKLQKMGFTNVKNLYGGIFDWKNQGNEVISESGEKTEEVHTYNKEWSQWLFTGKKVY